MTMKTQLSILVTLVMFIVLSCKNETTTAKIEYNYSDKPTTISCKNVDTLLLKEAYYTFENDIVNFFDKDNQNVTRAISAFVRSSANINRIQYNRVVTDRTIEIYNTLKLDTDLWDGDKLNYNHPIFECIGNNIKDPALKSTYNALISTNSMKPNLFGPPLSTRGQMVISDKYLATFVALQYYYENLANVTPAPTAEITPAGPDNSPVDFNKVPR